MPRRDVIHVVPQDHGGWVVRRESGKEPIAIYRTQGEAQEEARRMAREECVEYVLHGRKGQVEQCDGYDDDLSGVRGNRRTARGTSIFLRPHRSTSCIE
ncbi:DUF2188 domain-containing protein [Blastococcus atacamensis]|uniref:DUF2188 domain-containing protein n=1 Tax=Blastococcus atacamensis TaxID=2070508 RepID=UPI000CECCC53